MAITNHERLGKVLELLKSGLAPLIRRGGCWLASWSNARSDRPASLTPTIRRTSR